MLVLYWNTLVAHYAGFRMNAGSVIGDPDNVKITNFMINTM